MGWQMAVGKEILIAAILLCAATSVRAWWSDGHAVMTEAAVLAALDAVEMRAAIEAQATLEGDGVGAGNRANRERQIVVNGRADALPLRM